MVLINMIINLEFLYVDNQDESNGIIIYLNI